MRNINILVVTFLLYGCGELLDAKEYAGTVINVADCGSITILHKGKELRIRLAEIDAPERGQPFWRKSKQALEDML